MLIDAARVTLCPVMPALLVSRKALRHMACTDLDAPRMPARSHVRPFDDPATPCVRRHS